MVFLPAVMLFAMFAIWCGMPHLHGADPRPPNVVIFLADDAGWGDYGINGNRTVRTPRSAMICAPIP